MFWIGLILMILGLTVGLTAIYKTRTFTISAIKLGLMCYGGLFIALAGAILIGRSQ